MPLSDIFGNEGIAHSHRDVGKQQKDGIIGFTVIVIDTVDAHCPSFGENVYVVVAVLSKAGDQVPVIPSTEVVGKSAKIDPAHIGATCVNVGVTFGFTVMFIVVAVAHCPSFGVNV